MKQTTNQKLRTMKSKLESKHATLTNITEQLQEIVLHRESVFDNRSESWQESDTGEQYSEHTQDLELVINDLDAASDSLLGLIQSME